MYLASKKIQRWILVGLVATLSNSCGNLLEDYPDKNSNEYLMDRTRKLLDDENFEAAITTITPALNRNPTDPDVAYLAAVAYAGRGGLRILNVISRAASDGGTDGVLKIFAKSLPSSDVADISDFNTAVDILEAAGATAALRNSEHNFFALFLYFARLGVYLNSYGFLVDALRSNFTGCHTVVDTAAASTGITNSDLGVIYITLPRIIETSAYVTGSDDGLSDILDVVDDLPTGLSRTTAPCVATPNDANCLAVRTMINSANPVGLNQGGVCAAVTP